MNDDEAERIAECMANDAQEHLDIDADMLLSEAADHTWAIVQSSKRRIAEAQQGLEQEK